MSGFPSTWDCVVVGAGPAGSLMAREVVRQLAHEAPRAQSSAAGRVLLVERESFPRWKVCGACLSPGALSVLERVGLGDLVANEGGAELTRLLLSGPGGEVSLPLLGSQSLSRSRMDAALLAAAAEVGVTAVTDTRAQLHPSLPWDGLRGAPPLRTLTLQRRGEDPVVVEARLVVDASGLGGLRERGEGPDPLSDSTPTPEVVYSGSRVGIGATYPAQGVVNRGALRMVVGRDGYVGMVRVEDGTVNLAAAVDAPALRKFGPEALVQKILAPHGLELLGEPLEGWRGTLPLTRTAGSSREPRLLRVGDAQGYVEPFTGEGMTWALTGAVALAPLAVRATLRWEPELQAAWDRYRHREGAKARRLCRTLAWGLRRPILVRSAISLLRVSPALARPLVRQAAVPPLPQTPLAP